MKKIFFSLLTAALFACGTADKKAAPELTDAEKTVARTDSANFTSVQWLDSTFQDLGKLKLGQSVEVTYRFRNTGTKNLVVTDVTAGCGCTVPEKPEKPIAPGEEGVIKARFNSEGRPTGSARKSVDVRMNTEQQSYQLSFGVDVIN